MFARLFRRESASDPASRLYRALVEKARDPLFYTVLGVPDTVDGRFDLVIVHAMVVLRRLRDDPAAEAVGQALFDLMFKDMDQSLRELGVGDMSVGKHIKRMAKAFYGRAAMYEAGLDDPSPERLASALEENLFRHAMAEASQIERMQDYLRRIDRHVASQDLKTLIDGRVDLVVPVVDGSHAS